LSAESLFRDTDCRRERDMAEALAVSRPTLRQSMRALQIMGVIKGEARGRVSYLAESAGRGSCECRWNSALAFKTVAKTDLFETRAYDRGETGQSCRGATHPRRSGSDASLASVKWRKQWATRMPGAEASPSSIAASFRRHANGVMATIIEMLSQMLTASRKETVRLLSDYPEFVPLA